MNLASIVLCGGQSKRMGQPKAWLQFPSGEYVLQHIVNELAKVSTEVILVSAPGQQLPAIQAKAVTIIQDHQEYLGPLNGFLTGLRTLASQSDGNRQSVFLTACDVPFLTSEFVLRLQSLLANFDCVCPLIAGQQYPLSAIYRQHVLPAVAELVQANDLRFKNLLPEIVCHFADEAEINLPAGDDHNHLQHKPWTGVNSIEEWQNLFRDHHADHFPPNNT